MSLTKETVTQTLKTVNDPELHRDLVTLNMVKQVSVCDGHVKLQVELTTPACPMKDRIQSDIARALKEQFGDELQGLAVDFTANVPAGNPTAPSESSQPQQPTVSASGPASGQPGTASRSANAQAASKDNPLPNVRNIIAVGAGKGGVGKSTVAVNLAVGLARAGATVGLLDGDIYGPSLPTMLKIDELQPKAKDNKTLIPFDIHGIKAMSLGVLVEDDKPLIWRGPMAHGAFSQLVNQTDWGTLDYLIIDLPPGTGDVPLTMSQTLPITGAVVVCTPQKVAQDDARRAVGMFRQLNIDVLGVVENMSYFIGDDGKEYDIFGKGGAEMMAQQMGLPFLGQVPISMALRQHSDAGTPLKNFEDPALARPLTDFVETVAGQVSVAALGASGPEITVE